MSQNDHGQVAPLKGTRQWEPFTANHTKSLKHGARSERMITPLAAAISNDLMRHHEHLQDPLFRDMVLEYARVAAQVDLLQAYVDETGTLERNGDVRNASEFLLKTRKHYASLANKLGLTPEAQARMNRDNALSEAATSAVDQWIGAMLGREVEAPADEDEPAPEDSAEHSGLFGVA